MHKNCHRWSITPAVLVILCVLTAVVVSGTGAASASARIDTSEAASDIQPDDVASTFEIASAQALRDRVPATLFPAVTATLQSTGTSDMYEAIPGLSGERAYRLENPPHSMSAEFDTLGVSISSGNEGKWTWSLRFAGYARGRAVGPVEDAHLTADSNRVEYRYPDGVTEWYVNGPLGLQQVIRFESRLLPSVDGTLEVRMALSGDVTVEVNEGGASAFLRSRGGRNTLRYGGLYAYDAAGVELGTRLEATSSGLSILVEDLGAQYPITIDPFIEKDYLSGSAEDPREKFGASVSISGDTVVVGAPNTHWGSTKGAAYVFTVPEGGETSVPGSVVLASPRAMEGDIFGFSVAISGDTIVVGAPGEGLDEQGDRTFKGVTYSPGRMEVGCQVQTQRDSPLRTPRRRHGLGHRWRLAVTRSWSERPATDIGRGKKFRRRRMCSLSQTKGGLTPPKRPSSPPRTVPWTASLGIRLPSVGTPS